MGIAARIFRNCRVAARRAGLIGDGVARLRRYVCGALETRGEELFRSSGVPGAAIVVRLPDGSRLERFWGVTDAETRRPMDGNAVFQMMSISKPVSAMCLMRLVEQGVLELHAPVSRYLRSWTMPPERRGGHDFEGVTIHRLLSHTAGLNLEMMGWSPVAEGRPTPAELMDGVHGSRAGLGLAHAPGTRVEYSGAGFTLAEQVALDATGRPWHELVRELVLEPLGMTRSSYLPEGEIGERLATRHDASGAPMPRAWLASASGSGLYSTPGDVCTFWESFLDGPPGADGRIAQAGRGVITPAHAAMMTSVQTRGLPGKTVGLGFYLWEMRSDVEFAHRGNKDGWWSMAEGVLRRRCVVVGCSNGDAGERCIKPLVTAVRQVIFDQGL